MVLKFRRLIKNQENYFCGLDSAFYYDRYRRNGIFMHNFSFVIWVTNLIY